MISKPIRSVLIAGIVGIVLILAGCPSPAGLAGGSNAEAIPAATVSVDPARGVAVLADTDGSETLVQSEENGEIVECVEVSDYILVDDGGIARHADGHGGLRAVVLGTRSDGTPGIWVLYRGGIVVVPESEDGDFTSELLEAASEADGFHRDDGWIYTAAAISDDMAIIVGVAENPEAEWLTDYLGIAPQVVVWWNLYEKDGKYFLSRARVVADYPEWDFKDLKDDVHEHGRYRHVNQWMRWFFDHFGLWFFGWADDYLGDLAGEDVMGDEKVLETAGDGTYGIFGYDKDGDFAKAVITPYKVLSIDKTEPPVIEPEENQAPFDLTAAVPNTFSFYTIGQTSQLYVDPSVGDPSNDILDPDGDAVSFIIVDPPSEWTDPYTYVRNDYYWSLDPDTGVITAPPIASIADMTFTFSFATTDGEFTSDPLTVVFTYTSGGGS